MITYNIRTYVYTHILAQTCGAVEASHSDKSGATKVSMLKEGINFWDFDR